ncbi:MAG: hypothetical protein LBD59_09350 [Prevotellaceae bacterium]|jgi:fibronectin type 3 domain-containing protein|nr:hypothetical protein [Prevotellaceae bacterium]
MVKHILMIFEYQQPDFQVIGKTVFAVFILLFPFVGFAQEAEEQQSVATDSAMEQQATDTAFISLRARVQQDTVLLRWAASSATLWFHTNKYGFDIERYTLVRDGKVLDTPEIKKLNSTPVKAKPLDEWEAIANSNNYAAIIAQALYGEDFTLSDGDETSISKIVAISQEREQRFSMSLYAADQSFAAALMAGWAWRDTDVRKNERYLYRVIPLNPEQTGVPTGYGAAFVAIDEPEHLPQPFGLTGVFNDKNVILVWDYTLFSDVYNSYFIEKSTDSIHFVRLGDLPVTNFNSKNEEKQQRIYFTDSLENNTDTYWYRIVGLTSFGETGPPSEPISGKGKQMLPYIPYITVSDINEHGNLELEWEFDQQGNTFIKGFELSHSEDANNYQTLVTDINPEKRSFLVARERLTASNYFVITAIPHEGEPASSFPVLVQPIDSVPPAVPTGLTGTVDTAGIVRLTWKNNTERDLLGYRVYRSQLKDEESTPLFYLALNDTVYSDTVNVRNLNKKVFYSVAALDKRYNQSDLSPVLELEKPDLTPPSSPVLANYKIRDDGIEISWINSPDADVVRHRIWRREKSEGYSPASILAVINDSATTTYVDTSAVVGVHYIYTVTAAKRNLLESRASNALTLFTNKPKGKTMTIDRLDAVMDKQNKMLKLIWSDKLRDVVHYEIYKGVNDEKMTLWKTVPANKSREILDENLLANDTYRYAVRAILKSGKNTGAKTLTVKF